MQQVTWLGLLSFAKVGLYSFLPSLPLSSWGLLFGFFFFFRGLLFLASPRSGGSALQHQKWPPGRLGEKANTQRGTRALSESAEKPGPRKAAPARRSDANPPRRPRHRLHRDSHPRPRPLLPRVGKRWATAALPQACGVQLATNEVPGTKSSDQ